jgi:hypothetical protein
VRFPLVILVVVVPKQKQAVPNAPVATRVKRVRAPVARVTNAQLVNLVNPMIKTLLLARRVTPASSKKTKDKPLVTSAF